MKKPVDDFFFKLVDVSERNVHRVDFFEVLELIDRISPEYFTQQLNRILNKVGGELELDNASSDPDFDTFLSHIDRDKIGLIEIGARKDVNPAVKATLDCSIFFEHGVVRIVAQWCGYKDTRSQEIVDTLLLPLFDKGLVAKTFIHWFEDEIEPLWDYEATEGLEDVLKKVFRLSEYPLRSQEGNLTKYFMDRIEKIGIKNG